LKGARLDNDLVVNSSESLTCADGKVLLNCSEKAFVGDYEVQKVTEFKNKTKETTPLTNLSPDKLEIFSSTSEAITNIKRVTINISIKSPELNIHLPEAGVNLKKYRTALGLYGLYSNIPYAILDVLDMNLDILRNNENLVYGGLFVPGDWVPVNGVSVFSQYPNFKGHVDFLKSASGNTNLPENSKTKYWFLNN
jgi:hypothetical protein